jgi:hypothetical protein
VSWSIVARDNQERVKGGNIYRGVFTAEKEVVKRHREEAMWTFLRATRFGQTGWQKKRR